MHQIVSNALLLEAASGFRASDNIGKLVSTVLLSMVPTFEGRYAVVTAIGMGIPVVLAYFLALFCSYIPVPFIMLLLRRVLDWLYTLPIKPLRAFAAWLEKKGMRGHDKLQKGKSKGLQGRLSRRFSAELMEMIGLCIFVAVPLPGTGVWTGTIIATLFELPRGKSAVAIFIGNVIACLITTLLTTGVIAAVH